MHKLSYDQSLLTDLFMQIRHLDDILNCALNGEQGTTTFRPYTNYPSNEYITGGRLIIPLGPVGSSEPMGKSYITAAKSWNSFKTGCNFKVSLSDLSSYVSLTVGPEWQLKDLSIYESENQNTDEISSSKSENRKVSKSKLFFDDNEDTVGFIQYEKNGSETVETYGRIGCYLVIKRNGQPPIMAVYDPTSQNYTIVEISKKSIIVDKNAISSLNITEKYDTNESTNYKTAELLHSLYLPNCFAYYNGIYNAFLSQDESEFSFEHPLSNEDTLSKIREKAELPNTVIENAHKLFNRANKTAQDRGLYQKNQKRLKIIPVKEIKKK